MMPIADPDHVPPVQIFVPMGSVCIFHRNETYDMANTKGKKLLKDNNAMCICSISKFSLITLG